MKRIHLLLGIIILLACAFAFKAQLFPYLMNIVRGTSARSTVADRVEQFKAPVHGRLLPDFEKTALAYPPDKIILVGLKQEKQLEVWAAGESGPFRLLKTYPILGASGTLGPKLREGDHQVPEGIYRIESLNPNSMFHLSLRVNYPNAFDTAKAKLDGRTDPGSDIMIHGKSCSVGCLAMGDEAAEDLFVLAAETGIENIAVILSPVDFRKRGLPAPMPTLPSWTDALYESIRNELNVLKEANPQ